MKRSVLLLFIAVVISSGLAPGQAKKGASKEMSLGGEVVDVRVIWRKEQGVRGTSHALLLAQRRAAPWAS